MEHVPGLGHRGSLQPLDFDAFVKFLTAHGHNFTLLWTVEMPKFCNLPITASAPPDFTVSPFQWKRTGPGTATDGGLKFDLTKFDQAFSTAYGTRTKALNDAGIYAGVYLFTGEFLNMFRCSSDGYPLTGANNINGVDDGYASGKKGIRRLTMTAPNAITRVPGRVCGKDDRHSERFAERALDGFRRSARAIPFGGMTTRLRTFEPMNPESRISIRSDMRRRSAISDSIVYNSDADWVAPATLFRRPRPAARESPLAKSTSMTAIIPTLGCGTRRRNRIATTPGKTFTTGNQVLFMDPYLVYYPRENRNLCASPTQSICTGAGHAIRQLQGQSRIHFEIFPQVESCQCRSARLAQFDRLLPCPNAISGAEYLVYAPSGGSFTVDLSAMSSPRTLAVEWFNPSTGPRSPRNPFRPDHPRKGSLRRSAEMPYSTLWTPRDTLPRSSRLCQRAVVPYLKSGA